MNRELEDNTWGPATADLSWHQASELGHARHAPSRVRAAGVLLTPPQLPVPAGSVDDGSAEVSTHRADDLVGLPAEVTMRSPWNIVHQHCL